MRKILFACVLLVGMSNISFADDNSLDSAFKQCRKDSMKACEEGIYRTCHYRGMDGNKITTCKNSPSGFCFLDEEYAKKVAEDNKDYNPKVCGMFKYQKGILLFVKGDYIGAKENFEASIRAGITQGQKAMGILCSEQSWVCNRPSPSGL